MARTTFSPSIRLNLISAISVMGLLALGLALFTGEWYKRLVLENERQLTTEILEYEASDDIKKHDQLARLLSRGMQRAEPLREALRRSDQAAIIEQLDSQYHQHLVTSNRVSLLRLAVYDTDFRPIAQSTEPSPLAVDEQPCRHLLDYAARRRGAERVKPLSDLCLHPKLAIHADLMPIGGLRPIGYLLTLTDPLKSLIGISEELHSPMDIRLANGLLVAQAPPHQEKQLLAAATNALHVIPNRAGEPALQIVLHRHSQQLDRKLQTTRLTIMVVAVIVTLITVALAFGFIRRSLLVPLNELRTMLQRVREDRSHLGQTIPLHGNTEIQTLAASFNDMSQELAGLYVQLEQQAYSDPLTQLPNRSWFHDQLSRLRSLSDREESSFALLILDLNDFKPINDRLGHQAGDAVLKTVSERINGVLRGSDYLARADLLVHDSQPGNTVARMGGDEFAILLPSTSSCEAAAQVAQKVAEAVSESLFVANTHLHPSISIGIAIYPDHTDNIDRLIYCADLAMYAAKQSGSSYTCYTTSLESPLGPSH